SRVRPLIHGACQTGTGGQATERPRSSAAHPRRSADPMLHEAHGAQGGRLVPPRERLLYKRLGAAMHTPLGSRCPRLARELRAVGRHFARLWPVRADPPRPAWLGVNYGAAALAAIVFVLADLGTLALPGATSFVPFTAYLLAMAALTVWDVQRLARSGAWQ